MGKDIAAVILAAGKGSRYKDGDSGLKQFARIGPPENEALIRYSLAQITKTPFDRLIFVVGPETKEIFQREFGKVYSGTSGHLPISYVTQDSHPVSKKPIGTIDAVCAAADSIGDSSFVIFNSDEVFGEGTPSLAYNHLQENECGVTVGFNLEDMVGPSKVNRGVFNVGKDGYVQSITEHIGISERDVGKDDLDPHVLCNINLFGFHSNVLPLLRGVRDSFLKNYDGKGECLLSTELSKLIEQSKIKIKACRSGDTYHGITYFEDVKSVKEAIEKEREERNIGITLSRLA